MSNRTALAGAAILVLLALAGCGAMGGSDGYRGVVGDSGGPTGGGKFGQ